MPTTPPRSVPLPAPVTALPPVLGRVVDEALGRSHRPDPELPRTGGPAGNARLTAWTGLILLVTIVIELITLLDVRGMLAWHVGVGAAMLVLALVKTGTTGYRIVRYYRHDSNYRQGGPPPMLLRLLGPLVILSTLALLGSGLVLVALGPQASRSDVIVTALGFRVDWVTVHQGLFIVFGVFVGLHLLARLVPAMRLTVVPRVADSTVAGRHVRLVLVIAASVAAIGAAAIVIAVSHDWTAGFDFGRHFGPGSGPGFGRG